MSHQKIRPLIDRCRYETSVDTQIELLYAINERLPESKKLRPPSLITNDYVFRALDMIEDRLSPAQVPTAVSA